MFDESSHLAPGTCQNALHVQNCTLRQWTDASGHRRLKLRRPATAMQRKLVADNPAARAARAHAKITQQLAPCSEALHVALKPCGFVALICAPCEWHMQTPAAFNSTLRATPAASCWPVGCLSGVAGGRVHHQLQRSTLSSTRVGFHDDMVLWAFSNNAVDCSLDANSSFGGNCPLSRHPRAIACRTEHQDGVPVASFHEGANTLRRSHAGIHSEQKLWKEADTRSAEGRAT